MAGLLGDIEGIGNDIDKGVKAVAGTLGTGAALQGYEKNKKSSGSSSPAPVSSSDLMNEDQLNSYISNLSEGQETSGASATAAVLAHSLAALPAKNAQALLSKLSGTLGSDVEGDISGTGSASSAAQPSNPYGFDPLSIGTYLSQQYAPMLQSEEKDAQSYAAQYPAMVQSALKGASPQLQQAYAATAPQTAQAMSQSASAGELAANTAPQFDMLVSGLTNAVNAAKGAQYAAAEEPYVAASQGLGSTAQTAGGNQQSNQTLANLYAIAAQQALSGQANTPSTSSLLTPTTAASQAASQQQNAQYSQALLANQMG